MHLETPGVRPEDAARLDPLKSPAEVVKVPEQEGVNLNKNRALEDFARLKNGQEVGPFISIFLGEGPRAEMRTLQVGLAKNPREHVKCLVSTLNGEGVFGKQFQDLKKPERLGDSGFQVVEESVKDHLATTCDMIAENPVVSGEDIQSCKESLASLDGRKTMATEVSTKTRAKIGERLADIAAVQSGAETLHISFNTDLQLEQDRLVAARTEICQQTVNRQNEYWVQQDLNGFQRRDQLTNNRALVAWTDGTEIYAYPLPLSATSPVERIDKMLDSLQGSSFSELTKRHPQSSQIEAGAREYLAELGERVAETPFSVPEIKNDTGNEGTQAIKLISERLHAIDSAQKTSESLASDTSLQTEKDRLVAARTEICQQTAQQQTEMRVRQKLQYLATPTYKRRVDDNIIIVSNTGSEVSTHLLNIPNTGAVYSADQGDAAKQYIAMVEQYMQTTAYQEGPGKVAGNTEGLKIYLDTMRKLSTPSTAS